MSKRRVQYEIISISDRGNELCSGGAHDTEHLALQSIESVLSTSPNATSWEIVKVSRVVVRKGKGAPTKKDLITSRHR
jgi:hypothetical protein